MNKLIVALALASAASAAPLSRRDECQDAYKACVAAGTPEVACSCTWTACAGEDNARNREFCASATASLAQPTKTGVPSDSKTYTTPAETLTSITVSETYTAPVQTFTSIPGIPGGCNPAHPGSCPSSYFTYTKTGLPPTYTPIPIIPGGYNPAHPSSSETTAHPAPVPTENSGPDAGTYPSPKPVDGKTWSIKDLIRYCGEDNDGCDYNFKIEANGKTERCTVIRDPGSNAATESWSNEPCTDGSEFSVSWGYVTEPAPAFAVITVVKGKELAWFGASDINGQKVTPANPFGSGHYGNLGPQQVYTY